MKKTIKILALLLLIVALAVPSWGAAVNFGTATKVYNITNGARYVHRVSGGTIYACVLNQTDSQVEMWKSTNGTSWSNVGSNQSAFGELFGDTGTVSSHIDGGSPQLIQVVYVYYDSGGETYYVRYNTFDTSNDTWGTPINIHTLAQRNTIRLAITTDAAKLPHVLFQDVVSFVENTYYINAVGSTYPTMVWNTEVLISGGATSNYAGVDIAIDTTNSGDHRYNLPQALWVDTSDSLPHVSLGASNNPTAPENFSGVIPVNASSWNADANPVSLVIDTNGQTSISCYYNSTDIYTKNAYIPAASTWGTSSNWTGQLNITTDANGTQSSLAVKGTDRYLFTNNGSTGIRRQISANYAAYGEASTLDSGTYSHPKVRWQYANNPSYDTYGMDYIFIDGSGYLYWNKISFAAPSKGNMFLVW